MWVEIYKLCTWAENEVANARNWGTEEWAVPDEPGVMVLFQKVEDSREYRARAYRFCDGQEDLRGPNIYLGRFGVKGV